MEMKKVVGIVLLLSLLISPISSGLGLQRVNAAEINRDNWGAEIQTIPVAYSQELVVIQGEYTEILLEGFDADEDDLQFIVTDLPEHGLLQGTAPYLSYTSDADYEGLDYFHFTVFDGFGMSGVATVSIDVRTNTDPVAYSQELVRGECRIG